MISLFKFTFNWIKRRFVLLSTILVLFILLTGFSSFLQETPDLTDLQAVLVWLATAGGSAAAVAGLLSLLAEHWTGWHNLPYWVKFLSPLVLSALLSIGANYLLEFQPDFVQMIAPWFRLVMIAILAYLGNQITYMISQSAGYAATVKQRAYKMRR